MTDTDSTFTRQLRNDLARAQQAQPPFPVPTRQELLAGKHQGGRTSRPSRRRGRALPVAIAAGAVVVTAGAVVLTNQPESAKVQQVLSGPSSAQATPPPSAAPTAPATGPINGLILSASANIPDCDHRLIPTTVSVPEGSYTTGDTVPVTVTVHNPGPLCRTTLLNASGLFVKTSAGSLVYVSCTAHSGGTCTADLPTTPLAPGTTQAVVIYWNTTGLDRSSAGPITLQHLGLTLRILVAPH